MDRTSAAFYATVSGLRMYQDANPGAGISVGTGLAAADRNALQEEAMGVIEGFGLTGDSANLKQMFAAIQKGIALGSRTRLTGNTTFYASAAGSDTTGDGTSGNPWATPQHAVTTLNAFFDMSDYRAVIACTGDFTTGVGVNAPLPGQSSAGSLIIDGGGTAQINVANGSCIGCTGSGQLTVQDFGQLTTAGSTAGGAGNIINVSSGLLVHQGNNFGSCVGSHICAFGGGYILATGNYQISGGAVNAHLFSFGPAVIGLGPAATPVISVSGTPAFGEGMAVGVGGGAISYGGASFGGTGATGPRYAVSSGGIILTNGGGANFFPGSSAGTNDGTGIYQ